VPLPVRGTLSVHPRHNKTLSVGAMGISNKDCSSLAIDCCDTTPTPSGFTEIVSDDLPVLHERARFQLACKCCPETPSNLGKASGKMVDKAKLFVPAVARPYFLMDMQPKAAISYPLLFPTTDSVRQERRKSYLDCSGKEACSLAASDLLLPA
jgi:hypothetical protein